MEKESQVKEEKKTTSLVRENYTTAIIHLYDFVHLPSSQHVDLHFENAVKYATLSANENYSNAQNLLNLLNSLGSLDAAKTTLRLKDSFLKMPSLVNTQPNSYAFLTKVNYMLKDYETGFCYLLPLLEGKYDKKSDLFLFLLLLLLLQAEPHAVSHFGNKICADMFDGRGPNIFKEAGLWRMTEGLFLDALCKLKDLPNQLSVAELDELGTRYWRVFCTLVSQKEYLDQAILYSLVCALKSNDPIAIARHKLIDIINNIHGIDTKAYDIYYSYLLPYLEAGDAQAQDLFNEVAYACFDAFKWFDKYVNNQRKTKGDQLKTVDRVMSNYERFISYKRSGLSNIDLIPRSYPANFEYFAGETPTVAVYEGSPRVQDNETSDQDGIRQVHQEASSFKGNWTDTFLLTNGETVTHKPNSIKMSGLHAETHLLWRVKTGSLWKMLKEQKLRLTSIAL